MIVLAIIVTGIIILATVYAFHYVKLVRLLLVIIL